MLAFIIIAIIVFFVIKALCSKKEEDKTPPSPPTEDVYILGCNGDCGYFIPKFHKNANGEYDVDKKMCYCKYLNQSVRRGGPCAFAKDHPDKLGKSLFDD